MTVSVFSLSVSSLAVDVFVCMLVCLLVVCWLSIHLGMSVSPAVCWKNGVCISVYEVVCGPSFGCQGSQSSLTSVRSHQVTRVPNQFPLGLHADREYASNKKALDRVPGPLQQFAWVMPGPDISDEPGTPDHEQKAPAEGPEDVSNGQQAPAAGPEIVSNGQQAQADGAGPQSDGSGQPASRPGSKVEGQQAPMNGSGLHSNGQPSDGPQQQAPVSGLAATGNGQHQTSNGASPSGQQAPVNGSVNGQHQSPNGASPSGQQAPVYGSVNGQHQLPHGASPSGQQAPVNGSVSGQHQSSNGASPNGSAPSVSPSEGKGPAPDQQPEPAYGPQPAAGNPWRPTQGQLQDLNDLRKALKWCLPEPLATRLWKTAQVCSVSQSKMSLDAAQSMISAVLDQAEALQAQIITDAWYVQSFMAC